MFSYRPNIYYIRTKVTNKTLDQTTNQTLFVWKFQNYNPNNMQIYIISTPESKQKRLQKEMRTIENRNIDNISVVQCFNYAITIWGSCFKT